MIFTTFSKRVFIVALPAIFLFFAGHQIFFPAEKDAGGILTAEAIRTEMRIEVRAVGELDAADAVVLSSSVRGDRGKIIALVEDGTHVRAGEVLVRLDPTFFEEEVLKLRSRVMELEALVDAQEQLLAWEKNQVGREIHRAESDLHIARLELRRLEKGEGPRELARLEAEARKAKEDYEQKRGYLDSLEALAQKGFANPTEQAQIEQRIEDAGETYRMVAMQLESYRDHLLPVQIEKAKASIDAAEVALEQIRKGGGYKIGQARATLAEYEQALASANQHLKAASQELAATVITAPGPGMVILAEQIRGNTRRKPRVGDQVWQNQPLVYLPDISKMIVKTRVREVDLHKIDIGKPVFAKVDAYPDLLLTGRVASIGVLADQGPEGRQRGRYFSVTIALDESDPRLRPGMTARINIVCSEVSDALVVPSFAVFQEGGKTVAFVATETGFEKREVITGAQNEELVEITAGLRQGEPVALSRPEHLQVKSTQSL